MDENNLEDLQWRVSLAKIYPKKAVLGWSVILGVGVLISSTSILLGLGLTIVLIATQATFLFPSTFVISQRGLLANYPIRKKFYSWDQIRRASFFNDACYLFRRKKPSNLDGWTGLAVFYGDKRDEVVAAIKSHLREDVAT
jgi:hypothetical protein